MMTFKWAGKTYSFDANACYDGTNLIKLPNGDILSVGVWMETYPPAPGGLKLTDYKDVEATEAVEV